MSLALIQESAKEVRRLAIAGSPLAVGDFRLKKLIAPLEQSGAKVPVFAQVAKSIGDLVNGKEAESAAHLLSLSTLLNAILYTQGQTGTTAEICDLELFTAGTSTTRTPARVLKPIIEALTTTGGGRFEIVKSAFERGAFNDLRLIEPSIKALDDNYPELADLVAEKILPIYGVGIIPLLKRNLELKGKKSDARRLAILHELDPVAAMELCKTALEEGSPEVKISAVGCLGKHEECIPLILEMANSKNKMVRAAALEALAAHDRPDISKLFTDLLKGKALDILVRPLRLIRNQQVMSSLLGEGKRVFDLMIKGDGELVPRYWEILDCLEERKDADVEEFLLGCLEQCEKLSKVKSAKNVFVASVDMTARVAELLYYIGTRKSFEAVLAKRSVLPPEAFIHILRSALRTWPADKVYQEFSPLLGQKKGADKLRADQIQQTISASCRSNLVDYDFEEDDTDSGPDGALKELKWDPRWLDAAIKADQIYIVCCLAKPGHKGVVSYLVKQTEGKDRYQTAAVFEALSRCEYPKITDLFLELIAKKTKKVSQFDYDAQLLLNSARYLPAADLPRLDEFATKLDEKLVDRFLEALEPLRILKQSI